MSESENFGSEWRSDWTIQAGLVSARTDGTKVYYRLAGSDVAAL